MNAIETRGLTKYYGKSRGIIGVDLDVKKGEVFGFIGPNGAGKSTTIRILLNFLWASSGTATVLGMDCGKEPEKIKAKVGYLPSEVNYYDDMRVRELLDYSASFYPASRGGAARARVEELAKRLDLDLAARIDALSFGNKKKVAIVQCLLHSPELLIMDEPTGGLDPLIQHRFFELVEEERARGATVFLSSHVLSEVQRLCDRVAIIKEGRILKVEGIAEMRANRYKKVRVEPAPGDDGEWLRALPGASGFSRPNGQAEIAYSGDLNALTKALAARTLDNLSIEEPSLEEVFMHYYEEGNK